MATFWNAYPTSLIRSTARSPTLGLRTRPSAPDGVGCPAALAMLKEGLRRSMVPPGSEGLPSPVWAVDDNTGQAYEARVTNRGTAEYHGYPVLDRDPLKDEILAKWQERAI